MKISLNKVLAAVPTLRTLQSQRLPAGQAYKLALLISELDKHLQTYQDTVQKVLAKYGKQEEDKWVFLKDDGSPDQEAIAAVNREIQELGQEEIELPDYTLSLRALERAGVELSATEIASIFWLLDAKEVQDGSE
jgi:hypothetical protein